MSIAFGFLLGVCVTTITFIVIANITARRRINNIEAHAARIGQLIQSDLEKIFSASVAVDKTPKA